MFQNPKYKNLHLILSAIIVLSVSIVYGGNPSVFLLQVFGFEVHALELKNILRAVMGLYIAFGSFWVVGVLKPHYWHAATLCNILFMGGLSFGRIISTLFDGVSPQFTVALVLEILFFFWGIYNLKLYSKP